MIIHITIIGMYDGFKRSPPQEAISVCGIFIDENYYAEGEVLFDADGKPRQRLSWQEITDIFIDDADDDTVFVGIDYHM